MKKTYVEFLYPGSFFIETEIKPVDTRDPEKIHAPKRCFGYRFFDREEIVYGNEILVGPRKNYSGTYYFGKAMSIDEVKKEVPDPETLIKNMEKNGWDKVVKTRHGNFQPLTEIDTIIAEE